MRAIAVAFDSRQIKAKMYFSIFRKRWRWPKGMAFSLKMGDC